MTQNLYQRRYEFKGASLQLNIIRSKRKTMALHVLPGDQPVEARVPLKCAWRDIDEFIESRIEWLVKATQQLRQLPTPPRFVSGEVHGYLGEAYTLDVKQSSTPWVRVEGKRLLMGSKKPECHETNQRLFQTFLKDKSRPVFLLRLAECTKKFPYALSASGLRIRRMKARWGSCSQSGEICLNSMLMQKSCKAIDLVITHELCHLKHFSHNSAFYALMDEAMPDWRDRETLLGPLQSEPDTSTMPTLLEAPTHKPVSEFKQLALL